MRKVEEMKGYRLSREEKSAREELASQLSRLAGQKREAASRLKSESSPNASRVPHSVRKYVEDENDYSGNSRNGRAFAR